MDLRLTDQMQDRYGVIRWPAQLLRDLEDDWILVERGRELAQLIPGCQLALTPHRVT